MLEYCLDCCDTVVQSPARAHHERTGAHTRGCARAQAHVSMHADKYIKVYRFVVDPMAMAMVGVCVCVCGGSTQFDNGLHVI